MTDGALVEPLAVSLYGVRKSQMRKGDNVLVLGGGTVALYTIYWARMLGAGRIAVLSRSVRRRELCMAMGADSFVVDSDAAFGEVMEALGGSPSVVFECVGAEGMLMKAIAHAPVYGHVVSMGFCTRPDPVMPAMAAYKCATVQFLVGYGMDEFIFVADRMDKGHVDPKAIVTSTHALGELPQVFEGLRGPNAETKVHIVMA